MFSLDYFNVNAAVCVSLCFWKFKMLGRWQESAWACDVSEI